MDSILEGSRLGETFVPDATTRRGRHGVASRHVLRRLAVAVTACTVLAACSAGTEESGGAPGSSGDHPAMPSAHVHGVAVNPADGRAYLATHEGLFRYGEDGPARVGPVIDLMGFAVAGPDHFYASGHPGAGADLPNPVGLIESRDGGRTWKPRSREGRSDFHALTATSHGTVFAFDGAELVTTDDGRTWRRLEPPVAPFSLGSSPDGSAVVVTSPSGPSDRPTAGGRGRRPRERPCSRSSTSPTRGRPWA